jgi:hypothetical protein
MAVTVLAEQTISNRRPGIRTFLEEAERRVQSGEATFSDWQKAKDSIRDRPK